MAALKLLFDQARRQCLYRTQTHLRPSPFLSFPKSLSSSSEDDPNNKPPNPPLPNSVPIQPVAYAPQPQTPPQPNEEQLSSDPNPQSPPQKAWTREDIRYVKDAPSITPVAYPVRVAPLPEDKVQEPEQVVEANVETAAKEGGEVEKEAKRIDEGFRAVNMRRRVFRVQEEEVTAPLPTLIKVEKKQKPAPFDLMDAIRNVQANAKSNFDETVEAHVRLGVDPKRSDLIVRGSILLPHSIGKVVRVAFFAEGADAEEARAAGADVVGGDDLIAEIAKSGGKVNFDKCFTTPQFMPRIGKLGRILGPRGLMPTAKQGLVSSGITGAVKEAKKGHVFYRMDKSSNVHVGLGKVSLQEEFLRENICAFVNSILLAKPAGLKKTSRFAGYMNAFHLCSTMGPGFPVSIQSISKALDNFNKVHLK